MTAYRTPHSVDEALEILTACRGDALIVAGGTDVLPDMVKGKRNPRCLVDITHIPGIDAITVEPDHVEVGAAVTFAALKNHPELSRRVPALAEAAAAVGAPDIANAATWAGNLVQAMPAADGAIVALALDCQVRVQDAGGACWRPVTGLFAGPGQSAIDPTRQIITHIRFGIPGPHWGTAWGRLGRRESLILPTLNCAAQIQLIGGRVARAAIALGPVAPIPLRAAEAEKYLIGTSPDDAVLSQAGCIARDKSNPRSSTARASREYRLAVIPDLVHQVLAAAVRRANGVR